MARLPQLENAETYRPCDWDLKADPEGRRYWLAHFREHLDRLADAIAEEYPQATASALASFRSEYLARLRALDAEPDRFERIDILYLDELRSGLQAEHGFHDPYRGIKERGNQLALEILPRVLDDLNATPAGEVLEKLAFGLMAGNLFDLGAPAAVKRCRGERAGFLELRASQPDRPWLVDDLDAWRERWADGSAHQHVAFFVDNAGSDVCLGCLPLARWMLQQGSRITLVANSGPALNDVTAPELQALLAGFAGADDIVSEAAGSQQLSVIASGGWAPLLDLRALSEGCVAAVSDADLIILHGMGRAIESNFQASFSCDSLRVAVLKEEPIARRLGGRLFDCVFRFEPGC